MALRNFVFTLTCLITGVACGGVNSWDPQFQPTSNAYGPCGAVWVSCRPIANMCCPQNYICPKAATDECEFYDTGALWASRDDGGRPSRTVPMTPEPRP